MKSRLAAICLVSAATMLCSCSDNSSTRLRYQAEQLYYEAEKAAQAAEFRGDASEPAVARDIRDRYAKVVAFTFSALDTVTAAANQHENRQLSGIAYQSTSRLVQLYFAGRRYDTLVTLVGRLINTATLGREELATTYYNYGRALQVSGKRDSALSVFSTALDKFSPPVDDSGHVILLVFNLPIRIHQAFVEGRDPSRADEWFTRAEAYYRRWAESTSTPSELSMTSLGNLGRLYEDARKWEMAVQTLSRMRDTTGQIAPVPRLHIAEIYSEQLGQYDQALEIYAELKPMLVGDDTLALPAIYEKEASIQLTKRNYAGARNILNEINSRWPNYYGNSANAQQTKARSFELEGNWERAETEYRYLIEHYADSEDAMAAYLYLASKAADKGNTAEAEQWYNKAEVAFKDQSAKKPGTRDDALALYFLAELHRQRKEWPEAASALATVFGKFPLTIQGQRAAAMAAEVLRDKLGKDREADSLLLAAQNAAVEAAGQQEK